MSAIRRALLLDTETTGLDPATSHTIEIGCILYDVTHACPVESFASLFRCTENPAEPINRIPEGVLREFPVPSAETWEWVADFVKRADVIIAHRAEFDRGFVPDRVRDAKPWLCSKFDLKWPKSKVGDSLVNVALAHDLGVAYAHRAMADCDLLARLLTRVHDLGHDLQEFLAYGLRPKATFQALVSFDDKDKAKAASFSWHADRRIWLRTMAIADASTLGFEVRRIES